MSSHQRRGTAFKNIRSERSEGFAPQPAAPAPTFNRRGRRIETAPSRQIGGLPADYKETEASAFAGAARFRGVMPDIRGGGGDTPTGRAPMPSVEAPAASSGPTGGETRTNANGVTQKGRNLSSISLPEMEAYVGGTIADFAGPSFPTQGDTNKITEGYLNTTVETAKDLVNPTAYQENLATVKGNAITGTNKPGGDFAGAPQATEGQPDPNAYGTDLQEIVADGGTPPNSVGATLSTSRVGRDSDARGGFDPRFDRKSGGESEPVVEQGTSPSKSYSEMQRRRAFLDGGKGSMQALRDVERGMGMAYAGGQHYANVGGELKAMNSQDARDIKNAAPGEAQALKDRWVGALSETKTEAPELPSVAQNVEFETPTPTAQPEIRAAAANPGTTAEFTINNTENVGKTWGKGPAITALQGILGAFK